MVICQPCCASLTESLLLDLIVQAKSGTGKTCVFCTIALDSLVLENPSTQVSVIFDYEDVTYVCSRTVKVKHHQKRERGSFII